MNLKEHQIIALWAMLGIKNPGLNHYCEAFIEFLSKIEERFGEYINLAGLSTGSDDYKNEKQHYLALAKSLALQGNNLRFNIGQFHLISEKLQQSESSLSLRDLHAQNANITLQEKLLNGTFTSYEWLNEVDLRRMLKMTDTSDRIKITRFNVLDIAYTLHFAREDGLKTVGLLVNKGADDMSQGQHWFALTVSVEDDHSISYVVEDSLPLNEQEKEKIRMVMEAAIIYQQNSVENGIVVNYHAYPEAQINPPIIRDNEQQHDSFSCGYRALHALLQNEIICGANDLAREYAEAPHNTRDLVSHFCRIQLGQVNDRFGHEKALGERALAHIEKAETTTNSDSAVSARVVQMLSQFSGTQRIVQFPGDSGRSETLTANDYFSYLVELRHKLISQKQVLTKLDISPCDETALEGLSKFCFEYPDLRFHELTLDLADLAIEDSSETVIFKIQSLLRVLADKHLTQINFIDDSSCLKEKDWQSLVDFMCARNMAVEVVLPEPYSHQALLQGRLDETISQHRLDLAASKAKKSLEKLSAEKKVKTQSLNRPKRTRGKEMVAGINIEMAQEQQQQQQQEIKIETRSEATNETDQDSHMDGKVRAMRLDEFARAVIGQHFNIPADSYVQDYDKRETRFLKWFGHIKVASRTSDNPDITGGTERACEKLFQFSCQFEQGVDFQHLPPGFVLLDDPADANKKVLDYHPRLALEQSQHVLAVQCQARAPLKPIPYSVYFRCMPFLAEPIREYLQALHQTNKNANYDRETIKVMRCYISTLALLPKSAQVYIWRNCFLDKNLNIDKFKFHLDIMSKVNAEHDSPRSLLSFPKDIRIDLTFINHAKNYEISSQPVNLTLINEFVKGDGADRIKAIVKKHQFTAKNINALFQIYAHQGEEGLQQLLLQWEQSKPSILNDLIYSFYSEMNSFEPLLSTEYINCFKIIESLSDAEYSWWKLLANRHCNSHSLDDLPTCLAAFQEFIRQTDKMGLKLYFLKNDLTVNHLSKTSNLKTALSFMLTILDKTKPNDKQGVWDKITLLPLQSDSAMRAIATPGCSFVVPEMACVPSEFILTMVSNQTRGYRTSLWTPQDDNWHKVAVNKRYHTENIMAQVIKWVLKEEAFSTMSESDIQFLKLNFYRNLAFKHNRLSLNFYRAAFDMLEQQVLRLPNKQEQGIIFSRLAAILISATTFNAVMFAKMNENASLGYWERILHLIIHPVLPKFATQGLTAKILSLKQSEDGIKSEFRSLITEILFKLPSLPALSEMIEILDDANRLIAKATPLNYRSVTKQLQEKFERIELILEAFSGDLLTQGRRFYPDNSQNMNHYLDACWHIYLLDKSRHERISVPSHNKAYKTASQQAKLLMGLLSTFNINTNAEIDQCYNKIISLLDPHQPFSQQIEELYLNLLNVLQGIQENIIDKKPLNAQDLIAILTLTSEMIDKNIYIIEQYVNYRRSDAAIASYTKFRWNIIGESLLERFGSAINRDHTETVLTHSTKKDSLDKRLRIAFKDLKPAGLINAINQFTGRYVNDIEHDQEIIGYLKMIMQSLATSQRSKFIAILLQDQVWKWSSYQEIKELLGMMANSPKNMAADFFYICGQSAASHSENLVKAAQLYLDTIVPSLPSLPGLKRFDTLPLATTLLLREDSTTLGQPPKVSTPAVEFWQNVMVLLNRAGTIELSEIQALWDQAPDKHTCRSLAALFNEIKALHDAKSSGSLMSIVIDNASAILSRVWGATTTPQSTEVSKSSIEIALSEATAKMQEEYKYKSVFLQLMQRISDFNLRYPMVKHELLTFINICLTIQPDRHSSLIGSVWEKLAVIEQVSHEVQDEKVIRSLLFWYSDGDRTPKDLIDLIAILKVSEVRKVLFAVITKLLDNDHDVDSDLIQILYQTLVQNGVVNNDRVEALRKIYASAPYPTINKSILWLNDLENLQANMAENDIKPCPRDPRNGFDLDKAIAQNELCSGVHFTKNELLQLQAYSVEHQGTPTAILVGSYKAYAAMPPEFLKLQLIQLVAITAELLYRAKAIAGKRVKNAEKHDTKDESYEINTTQYLSIMALLKEANHVTAGIDTGEGKQRIMMILNACQYALGRTVDFITSDVVLSKRDFLAAQSLFNLIGADSTLIYADSAFSDYRLNGINFSDPSNISLFRNRAYSAGKQELVIRMDRHLRALTLDEGDKTFYDMADTKFNYSAAGDPAIEGMEWVYPLLIKFFRDAAHEVKTAYLEDVDACTEMFLQYASIHCSQEALERLKNVSGDQLMTWQTSAETALRLQYKVHFNVVGDVLINSPGGPIMASDIRLIVHKRDVAGAKFSAGVHQCLTAYLNLLREEKDQSELGLDIATFQNDFHMEPEKRIIYSSSAQDFLDDYHEGIIRAVTGTPGTNLEIEEARQSIAYKTEGDGSEFDMRFISMPRHQGLKRVDKPVLITDNQEQHHRAIIAAIEKAMVDGQPVLLICENDTDSEALYTFLQNVTLKTTSKPIFQRVHSGSPEEEEAMINRAGQPRMVTISTSMIGRGTDIKVQFDSDLDDDWEGIELEKGLKVLCTYLPTSRELKQIFGRGGRKGEPGDAQLILNKENFAAGFQFEEGQDDESSIIQLQTWMSRKDQSKRLLLNANSQFCRKLYETYIAVVGKIDEPFITFKTQIDQEWALTMAHIRDEINNEHPDKAVIQERLNEYHRIVASKWRALCSEAKSRSKDYVIPINLDPLQLGQHSLHLLQNFNIADELAPSHLEKVIKLVTAENGCYAGCDLLMKLINHSESAKTALVKLLDESKSFGINKHECQLLYNLCQSNNDGLLSKILDAYSQLREKTQLHALFVLRFIEEYIEITKWENKLSSIKAKSGKCCTKLPIIINDIYQLIISKNNAENPDYARLLGEICNKCASFEKPGDTVELRQKFHPSEHFYYALKKMHEQLQEEARPALR